MVNIEIQPIYIDGFVDNLVTICLDMEKYIKRAMNGVPLAIHCVFRPKDEDEPISRDDILCLRKLLGEGALSEIKLILGWIIDSRLFKVFLSEDKERHWQKDIDELIDKQKRNEPIRTKALESMIGKLNHASYLVNEGRFFLTRLRRRLRLCKKYKQNKLLQGEVDDLVHWKDILRTMTTRGRSINHITFGSAQLFCISDACKYGIGGFNSEGIAWRWELPVALRGYFSLNLLEFIAARLTVKLSLDKLAIRDTCSDGIKIHSLTDSSSALSWMWKATFDPVKFPTHDKVARRLATDLMEADCSLFPSHIAGEQNIIADSLSRDFHLPKGTLIKEMYRKHGDQMPKNFKIFDLAATDISWIYSIRPSMQAEKGSDIRHNRSKIARGLNGSHSSTHRISEDTFWSKNLDLRKMGSSLPSRTLSETTTLAKRLRLPYEETPSKQPSLKWRRPSERMVFLTRP